MFMKDALDAVATTQADVDRTSTGDVAMGNSPPARWIVEVAPLPHLLDFRVLDDKLHVLTVDSRQNVELVDVVKVSSSWGAFPLLDCRQAHMSVGSRGGGFSRLGLELPSILWRRR